MDSAALNEQLTGLQSDITFAEGANFPEVLVSDTSFRSFMEKLRSEPALHFDMIFCLTCVDWKTHLGMVYHMRSGTKGHNLVVKCNLDRENPEIETVCDIWRTAELLEREVFDLFGVRFKNHPDLRRLLLTDDWEGWPLRKDYEDPVNMIKL